METRLRTRTLYSAALGALLCAPVHALSSYQETVQSDSRLLYRHFMDRWIENRSYCASDPQALQHYAQTSMPADPNAQRLWQRYPVLLGLCNRLADQVQAGSTEKIPEIVDEFAKFFNFSAYRLDGEFVGDGTKEALIAAYSQMAQTHHKEKAAETQALAKLRGAVAFEASGSPEAHDGAGVPLAEFNKRGRGMTLEQLEARPQNRQATGAGAHWSVRRARNGDLVASDGSHAPWPTRHARDGNLVSYNVRPVHKTQAHDTLINSYQPYVNDSLNAKRAPTYEGNPRKLSQEIAKALDYAALSPRDPNARTLRAQASEAVRAWQYAVKTNPAVLAAGPKVLDPRIREYIHGLQYFQRICMRRDALERLSRHRDPNGTLSPRERRIMAGLRQDVQALQTLYRKLGIQARRPADDVAGGLLTNAEPGYADMSAGKIVPYIRAR